MKVIAIVGTYRRGRVIDSAVDEELRGAREAGADTEKIMLLDRHIEFCSNCRACTQTDGQQRGRCAIQDDMDDILDTLDAADAYIFASPINFYSVTALMKRFIERLICYGFWPWGKPMPAMRNKKGRKAALLMTSSVCPAIIGRFVFGSTLRILKACADCLGAGSVRKLYFGMVACEADNCLGDRHKRRAFEAGRRLAESGKNRGSGRF